MTIIIYKKICKGCNEPFDTKWIQQEYCTKKCKNKYKRIKKGYIDYKTETRKCLYCNDEFEYSKKRPTQKYCSKKCRVKAGNIASKNRTYSHKCINCETIIEGKERKKDKYCCEECKKEYELKILENELKTCLKSNEDESVKDILHTIVFLKVSEIISKSIENKASIGFNNQTINYWEISDIPKNTRDFVLQRDNNECQVCKNRENLHIHHIKKRRDGGDHNPDNLITLCASCHRHIEIGDIELAFEGCFKNALKHYNMLNNTTYITFDEIYDELINMSKMISRGDIKETNSRLNLLLDKMDDDLYK